MTQDDRRATRDYYDEVGDVERSRLSRDLPGRVSFEVHRRFLADLVRPGQRVLEIGAGPGRFTTVLAELGARVVVTDFSPVQLELNRTYVGCTPAGAVVAYGGPLSYAFERTEDALRGLRRITGVAVEIGEDANDAVLRTGDLRPTGAQHVCQLFRAREIQELAACAEPGALDDGTHILFAVR